MSPLLWVIAILLGVLFALPKLASALGASVAKGVSDMANPRFHALEFSQLPSWVSRKLSGLRSQWMTLGFRELVNYTRQSPRLNYTCVLVSPDGLTRVHIWVARAHGIMRWLSITAGWPAFKREMLASPRYSLTTDFPGARRFDTSPVELLAKAHVEGELEFLIVPPTMTPAEVIEKHRAGAQAFAVKSGAQPLPITTPEQFFDFERTQIQTMAKRLQKKFAN